MEIPVLVEPAAGGGWVARTGPPFGATAEGLSADEAVGKVRDELARRVAAGAVVTSVAVPGANGTAPGVPAPARNPWLETVGTLDLNDPVIREWLDIIAENRRAMNADPNR
ncbi:MAG: hypothetical protein K2X82_06520 [Gemmataceae bacterium]|nr:hypothetical protein [Gemmataceae bacterium]